VYFDPLKLCSDDYNWLLIDKESIKNLRFLAQIRHFDRWLEPCIEILSRPLLEPFAASEVVDNLSDIGLSGPFMPLSGAYNLKSLSLQLAFLDQLPTCIISFPLNH
jgi:hypothetical protein